MSCIVSDVSFEVATSQQVVQQPTREKNTTDLDSCSSLYRKIRGFYLMLFIYLFIYLLEGRAHSGEYALIAREKKLLSRFCNAVLKAETLFAD